MFNFSYYKPGRGEPDDGERETLTEQAQFLADNLRITNQFFHELLVLDIISSKDINLVKGKSTREKMVATFVELLQRKPTTHYHKFMEVLKRTNQIFVYEEMERRRHEKIELKRLNKHDGSGGQTSRVEPVKYFDYDTLKADTGAAGGGRNDEELYTKARIEELERRRAELLHTNVTRPDYGYRTPRAVDNGIRPAPTANFTDRIRNLENRVARLEHTSPSDVGQWNTPRY